jgi:hypothetical protein
MERGPDISDAVTLAPLSIKEFIHLVVDFSDLELDCEHHHQKKQCDCQRYRWNTHVWTSFCQTMAF